MKHSRILSLLGHSMGLKMIAHSATTAILSVILISANGLRAQTEVQQHKVSIDSATGKTTVTTETIVKTEEEITPYTDMLNINPLKFIIAYNLNWMHKLSSNTAFGFGAEISTVHGIDVGTSWGMLGEFRFYPSKKSMHGFYVAPNISFTQTSDVYYYTTDASDNFSNGIYTEQMFSVGLLIGWQWFPGTDFSMGLAFGVDDYIPLNQKGDDYEDFDLLGGLYGKGTSPTIRFDLGYAW